LHSPHLPSGAVGAFRVAHLAHGWGSSWPNPHVVSVGSQAGAVGAHTDRVVPCENPNLQRGGNGAVSKPKGKKTYRLKKKKKKRSAHRQKKARYARGLLCDQLEIEMTFNVI